MSASFAKTSPKRIGILTGGGDAPGLNAVIRAVVKSAASHACKTIDLKTVSMDRRDPNRARDGNGVGGLKRVASGFRRKSCGLLFRLKAEATNCY
jgi:hypothetical protein